MLSDKANYYELKIENDKLFFRTAYFKAEKTSVLHAGVYTREFSSMLLASAVCVSAYIIDGTFSSRPPVVRYTIIVLIFVAAFIGANTYIFRKRYLELVCDRTEKIVRIVQSGLLRKKSETIPFNQIASVAAGSKSFIPENLDGIKFVQKISAQHGSPMPGLENEEEFITLSLRLLDGSERIIFAARVEGGRVDGEPRIPLGEIKSFLNS